MAGACTRTHAVVVGRGAGDKLTTNTHCLDTHTFWILLHLEGLATDQFERRKIDVPDQSLPHSKASVPPCRDQPHTVDEQLHADAISFVSFEPRALSQAARTFVCVYLVVVDVEEVVDNLQGIEVHVGHASSRNENTNVDQTRAHPHAQDMAEVADKEQGVTRLTA